MKVFKEYHDQVHFDIMNKLQLVKKVFEKCGFRVDDFTKEDSPYVFLYAPLQNLSFKGVRVYFIGDNLGFRVAKMPETLPYGTAYSLHFQDVFDEILDNSGKNSDKEKTKLLREFCKVIGDQMRKFFKDTKKAEDYLVSAEIIDNTGDSSFGSINIKDNRPSKTDPAEISSQANDYANQVMSKG